MKKYLLLLLLFVVVNVNATEKSITDYSYGVDGKVSTESISIKMNEKDEKESLVISTTTGIYVVNDNNYLHIDTVSTPVSTVVIDDINNDSTKDIVYAVNNVGDFYNLVAVSGVTGDIIWKTKISEEVYNYSAGFIVKTNKPIYKMELFNKNIAVIHDYVIEIFNYKTGKSMYKYIEKDNIWDIERIPDINSDSIDDFVISNQLGEVKALSGKNGKLIWNTKVLEDLTVKDSRKIIGSVTRNIWQVVFNNKLYAMGENGSIYNIDYKTGKIINSLSVFNFDESVLNNYYSKNLYGSSNITPIGKNSGYFKDFEIFIIGNDKALITAFINKGTSEYIMNNSGLYKGSPFTVMVDLKNMKELFSISLNDMEIYNVEPVITNDNLIAIPVFIKDNKLVINLYNMDSGNKERTFQINVDESVNSSTLTSTYTSILSNGILIEGYKNFSYILDSKLTNIVKDNNSYATPSVILNENNELTIGYKLNNKLDRIVKYSDLVKKEIKFEYVVTKDFINDGISSISITHDFNSDGVKDLTAIVNKKENNNVTASYILILDMKNGSIIKFKSIYLSSYYENNKKIDVYLKGNNIYAINDINWDKKPDLVLDGAIIDGNTLRVIGTLDSTLNSTGRSINVGDINKDGFNDFVTIEETVATIHLSKITGSNIYYIKTNTKYTYDKTLLNADNAVLIPDINSDGIKEIVFNAKNGGGKQFYKIVSGSDLKVISNINEDGISNNSSFFFLNADLDNDGYNDYCERKNWDTIYKIVSGKTGKEIISISINAYGEDYVDVPKEEPVGIIPFMITDPDLSLTIGNDINKDGHNELFFLKESYYPKQATLVQIFDAYNKNNTPIKEIPINSSNNSRYYSYDTSDMYITKLITKISNSENLYIIKSTSGNSMIYNIDEEKSISGFNKSIKNVIKVGDNTLFGVNSLNEPININYKNDLKITNIKDKNEYNSPLKLKWDYEDYGGMNIVKIYDNGSYLKTVYGNNTEVFLRKGKHNIIFESTDRWGKILSGSIEININKGNGILVIYTILSIVLLLLVGLISYGTKIRRILTIRRLKNG